MKKLLLPLLLMMLSCVLITGCKKTPHWSYKDCLIDISEQINTTVFDYTVKEIDHNETSGDEEVHCFDITITSGEKTTRWCCFSVIQDGEVLYVDCDRWQDEL